MDLAELITLAVVLFIVIPAPLFIILHFVTKWKQSREISRDDEQMLEDLWVVAERYEDRLSALEKILDDDAPDWRKKQ